MGLLKKIELANNFSSVERILGKYVLENGEKVLNMSTKELAKATFTSPASICLLYTSPSPRDCS